ncbi:MAG: D-alanyl-D-alanine carboxypeptidase family protein [Chloroflexota bacterium]
MPRIVESTLFCLALLGASAVLLAGCTPEQSPAALAAEPTATSTRPPVVVTQSADPPATSTPVETPLPTPTDAPTLTPTAVPTATPIPTATPDRTIACSQRLPYDDLLTIVTLTYGLSPEYAPSDLVPLSDYLSSDVTLGYPTEIRQIAAEPLAAMIADMQSAGLHPEIISGYRSYSAQAIAYQKWAEKEPERVSILSAPPGKSEHQLGTVVDFGSPELAGIVGQEDIEFHTWFYKTSEGVWLAENAQRYGFTLSYPFEATEVTGFFYEPWHYRYVGEGMATRLKNIGLSLTEYQLSTEPPPCVPETP